MKNLLLLGDSIRKGYDDAVKKKLDGKANVFYSEDNGRFAQYTLRALSDWKGELNWQNIDVVHWNNGLWDVLHLNAFASGADGEADGETICPENVPNDFKFDEDPLTPPDMYRYMLKRVYVRIRQLFPGAKIIFATTTPVIEEQSNWAYRSNAEIDQYNQIARDLLIPLGVSINELGKFSAEHCTHLHQDWVHYNPEGAALQADEIIDFLQKNNFLQ